MSDVEHLFICLLAICMSSLENVCLVLLPIFWLDCLFFWYWAAWAACIFCRLIVCQLFHLLLFSPILKAVYLAYSFLCCTAQTCLFFSSISRRLRLPGFYAHCLVNCLLGKRSDLETQESWWPNIIMEGNPLLQSLGHYFSHWHFLPRLECHWTVQGSFCSSW